MSKTVRVPHLGGIDVGYRLAQPIKQSKPTVAFVSGITNNVDSFTAQLNDEELRERLNLIAIDPLGNGQTQAKATDNWTYWDSAIAVLQALDALNVRKFFLVGVSSGGWTAVRAALYSPEVVLGVVLVGTSLDSENPEVIQRGCMDCIHHIDGIIKQTSTASEDYKPPTEWGPSQAEMSLGSAVTDDHKKTMSDLINTNYSGDAGRKRLRQTFINMRTRDSLHPRLPDVKSAVLWLQGDQDKVFSAQNAEYEVKLLTGSANATVQVIPETGHLVNIVRPQQFNEALSAFTAKYGDKPDARKLREAIGMVDI